MNDPTMGPNEALLNALKIVAHRAWEEPDEDRRRVLEAFLDVLASDPEGTLRAFGGLVEEVGAILSGSIERSG